MNDDVELRGLISLLDSEPPDTVEVLLRQVHDFAPERRERLLALASPSPTVVRRLALVEQTVRRERLARDFSSWRESPDLEEGVVLVARTAYPDLSRENLARQLDDLADLIARAPGEFSGSGALARMNHVLVGELGFHGDSDDYYNPENSYINRVLERRTGLPITLSVLYILLGRRLGLRVEGVSIPGHFIARLSGNYPSIYFDPFRRGVALPATDVQTIEHAIGRGRLDIASPLDVVRRMLANLIVAFQRRENPEMVATIEDYAGALGSGPA